MSHPDLAKSGQRAFMSHPKLFCGLQSRPSPEKREKWRLRRQNEG